MACPYFLPEGKLETGQWTHTPRWPLGNACAGVCHSQPGEIHQPPDEQQQLLCNSGYARGLCDRFPSDATADAVRFSVVTDERKRLRVAYIFEREHAPVAFGTLEYTVAEHAFKELPDTALLGRQAEAFIESYLKMSRGSQRAAASRPATS